MGRSDIRDNIISRVVGIEAVKSHEAKPSVISPLYRKRIPEFHDCPCYVIVKARQRGNYAANSPSPRALARGRGLSQHNFRGNPLL